MYLKKGSIPCEGIKTLKQYLKKILEVARRGDAREESYYSALENLLNEFAKSTNRKDIYVTSQPKKTDAGNPDFRVWDGKQKIVGYIEAKTPDKNLDDVEKTEQVKRYKTTFPNFILTNFLEFRFYRKTSLVDKVRIADPMVIYTLKGIPSVENEEDFDILLEKFFSFSFPSITSAQPLAVELAKRTRFLCDEVIAEEIREEEKNGVGKILGFYEAFQTYLIRGLTKKQFADLYSQTITYGLFASRMRCEGDFNRRHAVDDIPRSIGILREMFDYVSLGDLPPQLEWIVDEISIVLANVDVKRIFSEFFRTRKGEDPVYHFYETFLAEYDPKERERRGVYYTPSPVVSYIVRSLDLILKKKFDMEDGLANGNVTILDPAAGTLTFIAEAIKQAVSGFTSKYGEGGKEGFIKEHILKNFYAFELMIAPYAIGHLKVSFLLDELGGGLPDENMKFFLTNTLELEDIEQTSLPGMASLARESRKAGEVKKRIPIWVILGNPPYSGISANTGKWITDLIEDYKYVNGKHFGEKKHWLQDDYVKFIRFAEWKIDQVRRGVVGYITNHSYLDNLTFRGMRQHLMKSFDEVYVLDLHGNSLRKEKCPDGSKDKNVFDIRQGVAIVFFLKKTQRSSNDKCKIFHSEIWGLRDEKYKWLLSNDVTTTKWKEIRPHSPLYFFVPKEERHYNLYNKYWKVTDMFPVTVTGIVTARDRFVIDFDKDVLKSRIATFRDLSISDNVIRQTFKLKDTRGWKLPGAREELAKDEDWDNYFKKILYRPFDIRHIYYTQKMVDWPRPQVMPHMTKDNLALITMRQVSLDEDYTHFLVSEHIVDNRTFLSSRGILQFFPLYLYENSKQKPNIAPNLLKKLKTNYNKEVKSEEILHYIYAIFYSNIYRAKYSEFLKTGFPRVPLTANYSLFVEMGELGKKLADLHLLKSNLLSYPIAKFQGKADNIVEKPVYNDEECKAYINKTQCFEGVEQNVWEYQIGGYQILSKWLKDRKGRKLSLQDIKHYCKVVTAIKKTIEIQDEIDKLYPAVEKDIVEFRENNGQNASLEKYAQ